jgi:endonuclease YncB( thermonuclease family)
MLAHMVVRVLRLALVILAPAAGAAPVAQAPATVVASPRTEAQVIAGPARVIDGDTIRIGGTRVRLGVIDAPERGQTCDESGRPWACGAAAAAALAELIGGRPVVCTPNGRQSHGRIVALCAAGGRDLSEGMAARGLARLDRRFLREWPEREAALVAAETAARAAGRGLWASGHEAPADWRAAAGRPAAVQGDPACAIKGNISPRTGERIHHRPGQRHYAATRIDPARGERWFCTEAEARRAGWRPARH